MGRSGRANASPSVAQEKKGDSYKKGMPYSTRTEQSVKMTFSFLMGFVCLLAYQIKVLYQHGLLLFFHGECIIVQAYYGLNSL